MTSVFLVDDDPVFLMLGRKMLGKLGGFAPIDSFLDGRLALDELLRRSRSGQSLPALVLLDIRMPVLDGLGFLEGLAGLPPGHGIRVVIVSSSLDPTERAQALASPHVMAFLDKPLDRDRLASLLAPMGLCRPPGT
ncbi:MAG: response regulator [Polyangiaceae bacterium]|jgi:CheY-like chemotaxis protein|nr:response regulator [Polyangiaceae bacterium]